MNPFSVKLTALRGTQTVEELAKASGVAASSIYKMESTSRVRWQTVEKVFGPLMTSSEVMLETLMLWALGQAADKLPLYRAAETLQALVREEASDLHEQTRKIEEVMANLLPTDQDLLVRFAAMFRASEHVRTMVKAWMDSLAGDE